MKKIFVVAFIISILITACGPSNQLTPSENTPTLTVSPAPSTFTATPAVTPTAASVADEKWKVINSIATQDSPIQTKNPTDYWEMVLARNINFSSRLQVRWNMEAKGNNGIMLTSTAIEPGGQWWNEKRMEIYLDHGNLNILLRDGVHEEPIYNNVIPIVLHNGATGEINITFGRQGKYIMIARDNKTLDRIISPDIGDFPDGLFPDGRISDVRLASGKNSSAKITDLEFLVPTFDFVAVQDPIMPEDIQTSSVRGGFVAIASLGELILLNHPGSGKVLPETVVDSMVTAYFWRGRRNERLIIGSESLEDVFLPRNLTWSPDGQHLTFTNLDKQGNDTGYFPYGLYDFDMSTDPARVHEVVELSTKVERYAWSPDGQYLAYTKKDFETDFDSSGHLFIRSAPDFSTERQVTDYNIYDFTWSPDGKQFAIVASPPGRTSRLRTGYIVNINDLTIARLTYEPYTYLWGPRWSPDGKSIAFTNGYSQAGSLYFVSDLIYEVSSLTLSQEFKDEWVTWSPDGNHALLGEFIADQALNKKRSVHDFVNDPGVFQWPWQWSPNGQYIAYNIERSNLPGGYSLYIAKPDALSKEITTRPETGRYDEWASAFTWSPDSNHILFVKYENDLYNLYVADVKSEDTSLFAYDLNDVVMELAWQP